MNKRETEIYIYIYLLIHHVTNSGLPDSHFEDEGHFAWAELVI